MCQTILQDPAFFKFLLHIDQDHAATIRLRGCSRCGGPLHQAHYERKPRDAPSTWIEEKIRFSFCCGHCRCRCTPASVRFLGRRVYWGATVLLATALCHGRALRRSHPLSQSFGVPVQTLQRWRQWWLTEFTTTPVWQTLRGRFLPPVETHALPGELLQRTRSTILQDSMTQVMRWLAPLGTLTEGR